MVAIVTMAFVIAKIPLDWPKIIPIGTILAFGSYIFRLFPVAFGIHTMFLIVVLLILLIWLGKGDFSLSLIASLLSFLALVVIEFGCLSLLMPFFGVNPEKLFTSLAMRIVITEPQVFLLFISAFLLNKYLQKRGYGNEFL